MIDDWNQRDEIIVVWVTRSITPHTHTTSRVRLIQLIPLYSYYVTAKLQCGLAGFSNTHPTSVWKGLALFQTGLVPSGL